MMTSGSCAAPVETSILTAVLFYGDYVHAVEWRCIKVTYLKTESLLYILGRCKMQCIVTIYSVCPPRKLSQTHLPL